MNLDARLSITATASAPTAARDPVLRGIGRFFQLATLAGFGTFGLYIVLRATGATAGNFYQWKALVGGQRIATVSEWIANLGIGMHFVMGTILVLAWPVLLSTRIRTRHRAVHRWTGRVYVTAGLLAGVGGLSFILTHGSYMPAASVAFAIWGGTMMLCAAMAYVHARAKRFDLHRAWAIRLFAMVLGSWLFDIEFKAWKDLTGGAGVGPGDAAGWFDYAILYLFFVPNLAVAEVFIRRLHTRLALPARLKWPAVAVLAGAGLAFAYGVVMTTAVAEGKFGKHLVPLVTGP